MGCIHVAMILLSLLSSGLSAPATNCETLIQPLEISGPEQLLGKWMHVGESTDNEVAEDIIKNLQENYWLKITAANETDVLVLTSTVKGVGVCVSSTFKMTLENNTLSSNTNNATLSSLFKSGPIQSMELLKTSCPDCLVLLTQMQQKDGQTFTVLQLLGKTRDVGTDHLSEFEQQARCLNLRAPYGLNPDTADKAPCPDPSSENTLSTTTKSQ
ncbi:uncharacterized protein V6R79_015141 [Siganus canaliculatus]